MWSPMATLAAPPGDPMKDNYACGIRADNGTAECWGSYDVGNPPEPDAAFHAVSSGPFQTCGILEADRSVVCWGPSGDLAPLEPPDGAFVAVSTSGMFACGIREDATLACWGEDLYSMGFLSAPAGSFDQLSAGSWHACAVAEDATLACWGSNGHGRATPP